MARSICRRGNQVTKGKGLTSYLVLDSSVIIGALRKPEKKHQECLNLLQRIKSGQFIALEPYSVLVEVVAAIKRRTGSTDLAMRVKRDLQDINTLKFLELTACRADDAAEIASKTAVRGMDALLVQVAREFSAPLVTLDVDIIDKAKSVVRIESAKAERQ